jgi:preprotein translocase subunit SecE
MGFIDYLRDTRGELRHVSWPSPKQAWAYTVIVLGVSIATGLFLGLLDFLFSLGLKHFV